ncbi:MAG TPA: hypothetical protein PKU67_04410 [Candidatus Hydrothermia bacterium]|mgnify:FL=1|nr:hypothetical protein [Candidatus Hydrothermia bacterium]HOK23256.1 hypothetical protein [Candidatus Hydrothermia bacterium]HOL24065.1 hypothetical protein [Candidatus Hydrothermia bacterium]HPO78965.1 hypothetical protein [Candidatus Hydrothermia bacterium]
MTPGILFFVILQIPFSIPESLIYSVPDTIFPERGEIAFPQAANTYSLLLAQRTVRLSMNNIFLEKVRMPVNFANLSLSRINAKIHIPYTSIEFNSRVREFPNFVASENVLDANFTTQKVFLSFQMRNWSNYFPKLATAKTKTYSNFYSSTGYRIANFLPYLNFDRVNLKNSLYGGMVWLFGYGFVGFQFKHNTLDAFFLNIKSSKMRMNLILDEDYTYGELGRFDCLLADSLLHSLEPFKMKTFKINVSALPLILGYEKKHADNYILPDVHTLKPVYSSPYTEENYCLEIHSDIFAVGYCHFEGASRILQDTLYFNVSIKEKYYDLNFYYNYRRHASIISVLNIALNLHAIKDLNPYIKINNAFNDIGEFLPGVELKGRFVEIGCQFQRQF